MYDYWLGGTDNFEAGRRAAVAGHPRDGPPGHARRDGGVRDHDPAAVQHSRALLGDNLPRVAATIGDMRDPKTILTDDEIRTAGFDLDAPACVILACVLHFVDAETAHNIASTFTRALAPRLAR
jgi:S-adenosyl methyltransferase